MFCAFSSVRKQEANSNVLCSIGILASVLSIKPRKVSHVVGTLTYSVLTGAPILLHRDNNYI